MNYFVHHQHQQYDPSSQNQVNQQSNDQFTNNCYSYSYPYPNPQFNSSIHPYAYQNPVVQPSQHEEQEPNPPGVSPPPQPEMCRNSYYQYYAHGGAAGAPIACPQPGAVDAGVQTVVHQPIVQPLYGGVGIMDGIVPSRDPQTHLGPKLNVSSGPFPVALPMNAGRPFPDQTVTAYGGLHIQGGPYQLPSQSYGEIRHGPRSNVSGRRGRGKGCVLRKHTVAPAQDLKFGASSIGQTLMPLQVPAQPASVSPPPKVVSCELCKVECNTLEVLQQHMNGKKHKKKLKVIEDLQNLNQKVLRGQAEQTHTTELKSEVVSLPEQAEESGNQQLQQEALPSQEITEESNVAGEKRKVEEVEPPEESAKKMRVDRSECTRRRIKNKLKGGKSNRKMRPSGRSKSLVQPPKPKEVTPLVCELCNVKCESLVVFQSHLAGKKHKSKAKRFLGEETFRQEYLQPQRPVGQNNATAPTCIGFQLHDQGFASSQNVQISNGQGLAMQSGEVEAISQPESLVTTNSGASFLVTAAGGSWNEGCSESGACSKNSAAAEMVGVAGGLDFEHAVTCRASLDGWSSSEQNEASIMHQQQQQQQPPPN